MKRFATRLIVLWLIPLATAGAMEPKLASVFSDHMVLQRDKPIRIWGHADPNASVVVAFAGQTKMAKAAAFGPICSGSMRVFKSVGDNSAIDPFGRMYFTVPSRKLAVGTVRRTESSRRSLRAS